MQVQALMHAGKLEEAAAAARAAGSRALMGSVAAEARRLQNVVVLEAMENDLKSSQ